MSDISKPRWKRILCKLAVKEKQQNIIWISFGILKIERNNTKLVGMVSLFWKEPKRGMLSNESK